MRKYKYFFFLTILLLSLTNTLTIKAQADSILNHCSSFLPFPYISDGQQYRALLVEDELAEFKATFYGGATYRIVACSGVLDNGLIFRLYDTNRNVLFESSNFNNTQYWDFKFASTVDCIIEAELTNKKDNSGFALLLIGFK